MLFRFDSTRARQAGDAIARWACCDGSGPARQDPAGPDEVAGIALGIMLQIILVLGFGLPEVAGRGEFGYHLAGPQAAGVHVGDGVFGPLPLRVAGVEDRRAVARAAVVALPV